MATLTLLQESKDGSRFEVEYNFLNQIKDFY